jgi:hypothetical protein
MGPPQSQNENIKETIMKLTVAQQETKKAARRLLNLFGPDGRHWAKYGYAFTTLRDRGIKNTGYRVEFNSPKAKSWCLAGACDKLGIPIDTLSRPLTDLEVNSLIKHPENKISHFNDRDGWRPVKAFLKELATHGRIVNLTRDKLDQLSY